MIDWLGCRTRPQRCTMFIPIACPQHAELHLLFSMITPLGWLERVPTYKEQQQNIKTGPEYVMGSSASRASGPPTSYLKGDFVPVAKTR